jgi:solute carrier family 44 (choline transporter-like protein), member 2/4/5
MEKGTKEYTAAYAGSIVIWVIVFLYCCFILCNWKSISLGASIMETASEFVVENKKIIYQPAIAYAVCLPIIIWWTGSAIFVYSLGTPVFEEKKFIAKIDGTTKSDYMFCYFVFGLFWILSWIIAMQNFSTICTTCMWYFTGEGSDAVSYRQVYSSTMAIEWAFKNHAGSMAMGSFLIAVVTMVRLVFEYIIYTYEKSTPGENAVWKCIKFVIRFVSWSLDCCVKFVNKNAYIQIALRNESFCEAAKTSFYLAVRNAARASAVSIISGILAVLGKGFIVALCAFLTISLVDSTQPDIREPYFCALLIAFWAYCVASIFLSLFEDSALTILYCFILDEE